MPYWMKYIMSHDRRLMDEAGDDKGGGGSGDDDKDKDKDDDKGGGAITMSKADHDALMARISKLESSGKPSDDDEDLDDKARKAREEKDKKLNNNKSLEASIEYNMSVQGWLEKNKPLLPKDISEIYETASNEKYDSAIEKANALKSGIMKRFFQEQANTDLLTKAQKNQLDDWLGLTNNGRQEKAQNIYDMIFEPAFENMKRTKKADALKNGRGDGSDSEYKSRLTELSRKHYLGEKSNA